MAMVWSGQPADDRDDELDLVDGGPDLELLDGLCDLDED